MKKGYVVRGKTSDGQREVYVFRFHHVEPKFSVMLSREDANQYPDMGTALFVTLPEATEAYRAMGHLRDVRIFAVAEDGSETALPSYEEALGQLDLLRKIAGPAIERGCEAAAAHIEAIRGDGVSFWRGADDAQRAATREMVEYLLAGESVARWEDPAGGEALRKAVMRAAWGEVPKAAVATKRILVTRRSDDVHAAIEGSGGRLWDRGTTADAAIGALVRTHGDALGIEVVEPEASTR